MSRVDFLRAAGWVSPAVLTETLTIIGCGAIGSNVALLAAKMGWTRFSLWDADHVESHNLPNQTYNLPDVGKTKVSALTGVLQTFNPQIKVTQHPEFFTPEHRDQVSGPLVIATDTMKSRYEITEVFAYNSNIPRVLEARLGFDYGEIHVIDPMSLKNLTDWNASLKDDSEIPEGPCNLRICATLVGVVSSTLAHYLCVPYAERRGAAAWEHPFLTRVVLRDDLVSRTYKLS